MINVDNVDIKEKKMIDKSKMGATAMFWNNEKSISERMEIEPEKVKKLGIAFGFYLATMGMMYIFL